MDTLPDKPPPSAAGIILAAGMGRRMGRLKQLLPFRGKPILSHVIEQGLAAELSPLILVLGHEARKIQKNLPDFPLDCIVNTSYESGMASSVCAGLKRLDELQADKPHGALFLLGDQPLVSASLIRLILSEAEKYPGRIILPHFRGKPGNPVYFDACFFSDLKQLSGDKGGRTLFSQFPESVHKLALDDDALCRDIDTPRDYEQLLHEKEKP